jgi:hypothetical protein
MANHGNKNEKSKSQSAAFVDAARALGCDESEERFDAALRKVAAHKHPSEAPKKDNIKKPPSRRTFSLF